ncbi:hypothetical protein V8F06_003831 [Rhypophila decipiens]
MALSELDSISIACIAFYTPSLFIASYLAYIHGYKLNAGWLYLVIFSVVRLMTASFQLASVYSDPGNINLPIGTQTLLGIGVSALVLTMLGLLSRVLESIDFGGGNTFVKAKHVRWVQVFVIIGMILGIVGGALSGSYLSTGYTIVVETKVGLGFMIAGFAIVVISTVLTAFQVKKAEKGEKRLLLAVGVAIPFALVRIVFSCMVVFGNNSDFSAFGGSTKYADYLLGMAIIMEMVCVVIFEGVGLTLRRRSKEESRRVGDWVGQGAKGGLLSGRLAGFLKRGRERRSRRRERWAGRMGVNGGHQIQQEAV